MGKRLTLLVAIGLSLVMTAASCSSGSSPGGDAASAPTGSNNNASLNKDDYPVFPDPDAGADPSVPAEQGGKGFTGQGWTTDTAFDLIGDPRAVKGGTFRTGALSDFPSTLRYWGPNITEWNLLLHSLVYETLLFLHPNTLEYAPMLATHWQISEDKRKLRFRIDPNARWSDGQPVTSEDVVASWKLATDKGLQDPGVNVTFAKFDPPVAESKYIVSVTAKEDSWRNFMDFATNLIIYPAHVLNKINGEAYVREYNYKMLPGTGPYVVRDQDVEKGKSVRISRRKDYWAEKHRRNVGLYNFDQIHETVVRDRNLEFEMFKRGDVDYYSVNRASMWVQELNYDNIKRGLNQKRKIFNHVPQGVQGLAFNTRREKFADVRVRKALRHLFNREALIEKLMFNEYLPMDSMFANSIYENKNNEKIKFDPQKALALLAEAGWKDRDSSGRLMKNGQPFNIEVLYHDKVSTERILTPYQEELRKVGITLNLRLVTWETLIKLLDERTFDMVAIAYTGIPFPNPRLSFLSSLADEKNSNNITGFKNKRVDELIAAYDKSYDLKERAKLLQEMDGIITNEHHWILEWMAPYERVVYWNKFGQPKGLLTRTGRYRDLYSLWWIDPEKAQKLEQAKRDPSIQLGEGPTEDRYWLEYARLEEQEKNPVTR